MSGVWTYFIANHEVPSRLYQFLVIFVVFGWDFFRSSH
jgi:hypothetical protein